MAFGTVGKGHALDHPALGAILISGEGYSTPVPGAFPQQLNGSARPTHPNHIEPKKKIKKCLACAQVHPVGYCTLKRTGYENCGLCGLAHFGSSRACPHLQSETQVRSMLRALKTSTETKEERRAARKYLQGVIGNLVMKKKKDSQQSAELANGALQGAPQGLENQPVFIDLSINSPEHSSISAQGRPI